MNQNKALWIFPNIKESVDVLPPNLRGKAWEMIINYGFGDENVEQNCKNLKVLLTFRVVKPLLRLRGIAGSQNGKSNNPSGLAKNPQPNIAPNITPNITPNPLITETETGSKTGSKEIYKEKETGFVSDFEQGSKFETKVENLEEKNPNKNQTYIRAQFEEWWSYFPKQRAGSKEGTYKKYLNAVKKDKLSPEWLLEKVKEYAESKEVKDGYACGGARYFNDCKYNNHYSNKQADLDYLKQSLQELGL